VLGHVLFEDIGREEGLLASLVDAPDEECGLSLVSHRMTSHFQSGFEHLAAESALEDRALGTWNVALRMIIARRKSLLAFDCCRLVSLHVPQKIARMVKTFAAPLAIVHKNGVHNFFVDFQFPFGLARKRATWQIARRR
jgi:hypothetical protein